MRAIAAGTVFLSHVLALYFFADPGAQNTASKVLFLGKGFIGVSFFFILSGFVLTWVSRDTDTIRAFWRRRAMKIFPNHVLTFIAAVVLLAYIMGQPQGLLTALVNLSLLHAWFGLATASSFNTVAWTLSCEALFYLLFPFILPLIRRIRGQWLWACCGALVVVIWIIPYLATLSDPGPTSNPTLPPDHQYWAIYILPAARLPEFILGMVLARVVASGRRIPVGVGGGIALTLLAGLLADLLPLRYGLVAVWVVPLALTVAAGAVADVEGRQTFLSGRAMVWLGDISFAFYLWHLLVLATGRTYWTPPQGYATPAAIVMILALLGVIILISWATFALYERPLMRRFARARRRLTPLAPVSPADSVRRSADPV
ncbi:MAG: acyltransferase family protein [Micromonosporaceae bacterium]